MRVLILGDSNLFYLDDSALSFPWNWIRSPERNTAEYIDDILAAQCLFFPLYRMYMSSDNHCRLSSIFKALPDEEPVALVLWIGQNDAWDFATRFDVSQISDYRTPTLLSYVQYLASTLLSMRRFDSVFILGYHNHPAMSDNQLYLEYSTLILNELLLAFPDSFLVPMPSTCMEMYVDQSHLSESARQEIAAHIASLLCHFSPSLSE